MPKRVMTIAQGKGGLGKSVLTFLLAEKHQHAVVIDADDATTTSMRQLAYRTPIQVSFLDRATQRIDRSAFNTLFESIEEAERQLFIVDAGASVSEQLPKYFFATGPQNVREMLDTSGIELQIICVVSGGNNFKASMSYLSELVESAQNAFEIIVANNRHYEMSEEQFEAYQDYCHERSLESFNFTLVNDKGELALRTAENMLQSGKGLSGLGPFKAVYFKGCLENLPI
jgi:hypothetical protein